MPHSEPVALVAIVGATGTGKSELSLDLAERLVGQGRPAEIVNADSMQLYRGMDVGTAKLLPAARRGIRHHMLDVLDVTEEATAAGYQRDARAAIAGILQRGATPILVGGSGLYVSSVLHDLQFPGRDRAIRARLEAELAEVGPGSMYQKLKDADAGSAAVIDPSNARRIVRALEVIELTGKPYDAGLPTEPEQWMPATVIGLRAPRDGLVERLDARVETMWEHGLLAEVESLIPAGIERGVTASRAIGYAQALTQLHGAATEQDAITETKRLTRRYARRQVSWFKRYRGTVWFDHDAPGVVDDALALVAGS